jgi:hypothetical protein
MPTTTRNHKPTANQNGNALDPPRNLVRYVWENLRQRTQKQPKIATATKITKHPKEENAPTALVTNSVPPSLQNTLPPLQVVSLNHLNDSRRR